VTDDIACLATINHARNILYICTNYRKYINTKFTTADTVYDSSFFTLIGFIVTSFDYTQINNSANH